MSEAKIDEAGLREVEEKLPGLAGMVGRRLKRIVPAWRFVILTMEVGDGVGAAYVTNSTERGEMIRAVRRQGRRLTGKGRGPGIHQVSRPGAMSRKKANQLIEMARIVGGRVSFAMPRGWGCALLLYPTLGKEVVYVSNVERDSMALWLLETAGCWERHEDRPPGQLGRDH